MSLLKFDFSQLLMLASLICITTAAIPFAQANGYIITRATDGRFEIPTSLQDAISNFENFEQWMAYPSGDETKEADFSIVKWRAEEANPYQRNAFSVQANPYMEKFKLLKFTQMQDAPPVSFKPSRASGTGEFPGREEWLKHVSSLPEAMRCDTLELAYLYGIWQMSVIKPTRQPGPTTGIIHKESDKDPAWLKDEKRAAWPMRFIRSVPAQLFPKNCHCHAAHYCLSQESIARWNFIFGPSEPLQARDGSIDQGTRAYKYPLGFANYMCGRTANAHFVQSETTWAPNPVTPRYFRRANELMGR